MGVGNGDALTMVFLCSVDRTALLVGGRLVVYLFYTRVLVSRTLVFIGLFVVFVVFVVIAEDFFVVIPEGVKSVSSWNSHTECELL